MKHFKGDSMEKEEPTQNYDEGFFNIMDYLDITDKHNRIPSIRIYATNRSGGKTYSLLWYFIKQFRAGNGQFVLEYRTRSEMLGVDSIFSCVVADKFPDMEITSIPIASGIIRQIMNHDEIIGFAVSISDCDKLKKYSPIFDKVKRAGMDEFQLEKTEDYLKNEVDKYLSVAYTISRGGGKQGKEVEFFLLGNSFSQINPYLLQLGCYREKPDKNGIIRGDSYIYVETVNESAKKQTSELGISKAFAENRHVQYATKNVGIYNDNEFIANLSGKSTYLLTFVQNGERFAIRECHKDNMLYINQKIDKDAKSFTLDNADHGENTILLTRFSGLAQTLKEAYSQGQVRFCDLKSKDAFLHLIGREIF